MLQICQIVRTCPVQSSFQPDRFSDLSYLMVAETLTHFLRLQTDIEISKEEDFARILQMEEEFIQQICEDIIRVKPDLVFTEKGISGIYEHLHTSLPDAMFLHLSILLNPNLTSHPDLAQHYLVKANITAIRRVRKTDNNRIAR